MKYKSCSGLSGLQHSAKADPLNLKAGDTTAWIDYDGAAGVLNVSIANGTAGKPAAPLISFRVDLSGVFREQILGAGAAPALDLASLPSLPRIKSGRNRTSLILVVAFSAFVALVVLAGAGAYGAYRYKNRDIIEPWELDYGSHRFKYAELRRATRGFRERELLGGGCWGWRPGNKV
ncbi:probable L-type lectin-domain containing receptor kinase I.5 [Sorghum bicolor]|uniref:probable L-type lectin-domain containing receptor kinase I.5 n=1 Tax=Sorghum bicolor TaxID=4558 RepID=UPI000B426A5C|nr:probable L-type lectin-domain containing receptor kinase I.5 [Sorghum bicolor]|eukprot:XP_002457934.2 probable L-type lectin-domain containing receptor kinase I.5 [Sorghum bicolor]